MSKDIIIESQIESLRKKIFKQMEETFDDILMQSFKDKNGNLITDVELVFSENDSENIKAAKAILNIMFYLSNTNMSLSLTTLFNVSQITSYARALLSHGTAGLGPILDVLYKGAPDAVDAIKTTLTGMENYLSLEEGALTGVLSGSVDIDESADHILFERGTHIKEPDPEEATEDPLVIGIDYAIESILKAIETSYSKSIRDQFVLDKDGMFVLSDTDTMQVNDGKSLLNTLARFRDMYIVLYYHYDDAPNEAYYYFNLLKKKLAYNDVFYVMKYDKTIPEITTAALKGLNPIMSNLMSRIDDIEANMMLKEGVIHNLVGNIFTGFQDCVDYFELGDDVLGDSPPYWTSRLDQRRMALDKVEANLTTLIEKQTVIETLQSIFEINGNTPLSYIEIYDILTIKNYLHYLPLSDKNLSTYMGYLTERIKEENPPEAKGVGDTLFNLVGAPMRAAAALGETLANAAGQTEHTVIADAIDKEMSRLNREIALGKKQESLLQKRCESAKRELDDYEQLQTIQAAGQMFKQAEAEYSGVPLKRPNPIARFFKRIGAAIDRLISLITLERFFGKASAHKDTVLATEEAPPAFDADSGSSEPSTDDLDAPPTSDDTMVTNSPEEDIDEKTKQKQPKAKLSKSVAAMTTGAGLFGNKGGEAVFGSHQKKRRETKKAIKSARPKRTQ